MLLCCTTLSSSRENQRSSQEVAPRRSRASSTPAERGLIGAGIVLCLVPGLTKQRLARFIALFVGGRSLRHPHAVLPVLEAALAGGAVRVEQRLLLRPLRGDPLLRLQVLLEEMVVVGGVGLRLPELLLMFLPHCVHVLGMGLTDGHGAMHRTRMARRRGLAPDRRLPCSPLGHRRPTAACRPASRQQWLPSPCGPSSARSEERWSARKPCMVGSSGVDRRIGTDADDCGYGLCSSLYSNGGRQRDGRVAPE